MRNAEILWEQQLQPDAGAQQYSMRKNRHCHKDKCKMSSLKEQKTNFLVMAYQDPRGCVTPGGVAAVVVAAAAAVADDAAAADGLEGMTGTAGDATA